MNSQLYIPKTIRVGYQTRDDTYTKRLAYVIYYDDKGKLRKETSWEGWRDKKIDPEEFDNVPHNGFVLNKDVRRDNYNWFGSGRSMVRVFDPRGIEFEITVENLIGVLMNTDCIKRQIEGECVYAWQGKELVLLPTNSEEYIKATTYTSLQSKKISAKDLVLGCSYKTKKEENLIYLGRFDWHSISDKGGYHGPKQYVTKKYHIFINEDPSKYPWRSKYLLKSGVEFLAAKNTEDPVSNYADLIEEFQKDNHSSPIVKWELVPTEISFETKPDKYNHRGPTLVKNVYFSQEGNVISQHWINAQYQHKYDGKGKTEFVLVGYEHGSYWEFDLNTQTRGYIQNRHPQGGYFMGHYESRKWPSEQDIRTLKWCDLYITLANGRRIKLETFDNLN